MEKAKTQKGADYKNSIEDRDSYEKTKKRNHFFKVDILSDRGEISLLMKMTINKISKRIVVNR
mgnify:CR=1|jgi:hypothetical protein